MGKGARRREEEHQISAPQLTGAAQPTWLGRPAVGIHNPQGRARWVLLCDHASNWIPPQLEQLGLPAGELDRHIAWDPGALELARRLADHLDAPLVYAAVSRLVLDVNRDPTHAGSIVTRSEDTSIPGNETLSDRDRRLRVSEIYEPYHRSVAEVIGVQRSRHHTVALVSIHSFTPIYRGKQRPWHIGVLSGEDRRMAEPLLELLSADKRLHVGDNEPYAPADGVYHTLDRHCARHRDPSVLLELRADLIETEALRDHWAQRLAAALRQVDTK